MGGLREHSIVWTRTSAHGLSCHCMMKFLNRAIPPRSAGKCKGLDPTNEWRPSSWPLDDVEFCQRLSRFASISDLSFSTSPTPSRRTRKNTARVWLDSNKYLCWLGAFHCNYVSFFELSLRTAIQSWCWVKQNQRHRWNPFRFECHTVYQTKNSLVPPSLYIHFCRVFGRFVSFTSFLVSLPHSHVAHAEIRQEYYRKRTRYLCWLGAFASKHLLFERLTSTNIFTDAAKSTHDTRVDLNLKMKTGKTPFCSSIFFHTLLPPPSSLCIS